MTVAPRSASTSLGGIGTCLSIFGFLVPIALVELYLILLENNRLAISTVAFCFLKYDLKSSFLDLDVKCK
jgi:hypothetical protein